MSKSTFLMKNPDSENECEYKINSYTDADNANVKVEVCIAHFLHWSSEKIMTPCSEVLPCAPSTEL